MTAKPLDTHAVLENTSMAKPVQPPTTPSTAVAIPAPAKCTARRLCPLQRLDSRQPRTQPPPPTCEDEIDGLAREYRALTAVSGDEVPSRGEFEQRHVLLEVYEYNPERRFVLVPEDSDGSEPQRGEDLSTRMDSQRSNLSSHRGDFEGIPTSPVSMSLLSRGPRREESEWIEHQSASGTNRRCRGNSGSIRRDVPPRVHGKDSMFRDDRCRSTDPSIPVYVPTSGVPKDTPVNLRSSTTLPLTSEDTPQKLPYSDDARANRPLAASMPKIPNQVPADSGKPLNPGRTSAWPPVHREHSAKGDIRRFSEGEVETIFPQCSRVQPVAGKMDWLTLPRTDFNICPNCYQGIFFNTDYGTLFQPMLPPTDRPMICDIGSSPWYRIAYLLTLKKRRPDLQLLHQVDAVARTMKSQPCPSSRKARRNWYGIRDPYSRRAVPKFTACLQCAKTTEVLLPKLAGVFVPIDNQSEPMDSVCSLYFGTQRQRFVQCFDTLANTADTATRKGQAPDIKALALQIERLSAYRS